GLRFHQHRAEQKTRAGAAADFPEPGRTSIDLHAGADVHAAAAQTSRSTAARAGKRAAGEGGEPAWRSAAASPRDIAGEQSAGRNSPANGGEPPGRYRAGPGG